ncbi:hypothetical protein [Synechococcus sp. CB0205]|uniref:hypothetical protein n=1 Tax=Synechococcus sp. CB0205 TaxID=232363 RepID=UPI00030A1FF9|nr:hypothetical protein [Synechococcus sp. CB0205]
MIERIISSGKAEELRDLLLQSNIYSSRLAEVKNPERMSLPSIHNILVDQGGIKKDDWLSLQNVVSENFFASEYKGVTSGRSGRRAEYTKPAEWIVQRDLWRQKNLSRIAGRDYAVVNIASRLFPHDPFDISILDCRLSSDEYERLGKLVDYYKSQDVTVIFRGFPARLVESLDFLQRIRGAHEGRTIILTTGWSVHPREKKVIENRFGKCNVFSEYGAQDLGIQLYSCEYCGMFHAENPRSLISISGRKIFSTDLYSHTQPVIAAETTDLARVRSDTCPAGEGLVFMPICMPPVLLPPSERSSSSIQQISPGSQKLLLGPNAHPILAEILNSGPKVNWNPRDKRKDYRQALQDLLSKNNISECRSLLASVLDKEMLLVWKQRKMSLVSFLLGFLVVADNHQWIDLAGPWLDSSGSDYLLDLLSATRAICENIEQRSGLSDVALLVVDIVISLFSLDPSTPFTNSLDSIEPLLEDLCRNIGNSRLGVASLPMASAINSYLSAYCWRHRRDMLEMVFSSYSGFKTPNMNLIEQYQSLGLLRKI